MSHTGAQITLSAPGGLEVGLGWLRLTLVAPVAAVLALLAVLGDLRPRRSGIQWYATVADIGHLGCLVAWDPRSPAHEREHEVYLDLPQAALDGLGTAGAVELLRQLLQLGGRISRLDIWFDDRARHVEPLEVSKAFRAGNVLTRAREARYADDTRRGVITYIGSRASGRVLRVYDKAAQSRTPGRGIRWELEAHGRQADALAAHLVASGLTSAAAVSAMRGFVDFVDRGGRRNGVRAPLLPWWRDIVGSVSRTVLAGPPKELRADRQREWLLHQVAPTFARLELRYGPAGLLCDIRAAGDARLNPDDRARVRALRTR